MKSQRLSPYGQKLQNISFQNNKVKNEPIDKQITLPEVKHYHNYKGTKTTKSSQISPLVLRKQLGDFRKGEFKNDYIARYISFLQHKA